MHVSYLDPTLNVYPFFKLYIDYEIFPTKTKLNLFKKNTSSDSILIKQKKKKINSCYKIIISNAHPLVLIHLMLTM